MTKISEECRAFLLEGTRTGKLATVRADGQPHIAPIWYELDGDTLIFTTENITIKAKNIKRDGRVSICVDEERPPFAYARIDGVATLSEDMDELLYWATRLGGRYMGQEQAEAFGKRNAVPGEMIVRMVPGKVVFKKNIAD
jgi:PPOX class probable F420-dependent enzyme